MFRRKYLVEQLTPIGHPMRATTMQQLRWLIISPTDGSLHWTEIKQFATLMTLPAAAALAEVLNGPRSPNDYAQRGPGPDGRYYSVCKR